MTKVLLRLRILTEFPICCPKIGQGVEIMRLELEKPLVGADGFRVSVACHILIGLTEQSSCAPAAARHLGQGAAGSSPGTVVNRLIERCITRVCVTSEAVVWATPFSSSRHLNALASFAFL